MKQFARYFLILLALVFALLFICDFTYTAVYRNAPPRTKFQYLMQMKKQSFDVVFIGSSRVKNHIDADLFGQLSHQKCSNMGVFGAGLNDNLLQLELLLNKCSVKTVFLQLDNNLETETPSQISLAEAMPYLSDPIVREHTRKYVPNYDALYYFPFYRYAVNEPKLGFREVVFTLLEKKPKIDPAAGFTPSFGTKTLKKREPILGDEIVVRKNRMFEKIKELCAWHHCQLVVFMAPFCSDISTVSYVPKIKKLAPDLIDLTRGFPDSLFYDCEHLNDKGARILTARLYETTKEQWVFKPKKAQNSRN